METTNFEDVEVILSAVKYVDCERCEENRRNGRRILNEDCTICKGWGAMVNAKYVAAALRMGLPVPMPPEKMAMARVDAVMARMRANGVKVDQAVIDDLMKQS